MPQVIDVRVAENGRMVLPRAVRDVLGLTGEARITLTIEDDTVRMTPMRHGIRRARELYLAHRQSERTVEDFLQSRRDEAEQEDGSAKQETSS